MGTIDTSFPKGQALADWLFNVGASMTAGQLSIADGRENVQTVNAMLARQWITIPSAGGGRASSTGHPIVEYLSFNAPLGVPEAQQCGRAVFSDLHVSILGATGRDSPGLPFPKGCQMRDLTAQEKAIEFLLFDLTSCVQPDDKVPEPPPLHNN